MDLGMTTGMLRLIHYVDTIISSYSVVAFKSHGLVSPDDTEPIYELPVSSLQLKTCPCRTFLDNRIKDECWLICLA